MRLASLQSPFLIFAKELSQPSGRKASISDMFWTFDRFLEIAGNTSKPDAFYPV